MPLTGDNSKERRERALIGAGVGALTGAGVGAYMDKQEAKLRAQLQGTGVSVTRSGNDLILNMPGNITFKTASSDLNADFYKVLDSVALVLKEFDKTLIDVEGHTDSDGERRLQPEPVGAARELGGQLPAVAWREQPAHRDGGCRREPSGRSQRHRRRPAAESPRGAQAAAHRCAADLTGRSG